MKNLTALTAKDLKSIGSKKTEVGKKFLGLILGLVAGFVLLFLLASFSALPTSERTNDNGGDNDTSLNTSLMDSHMAIKDSIVNAIIVFSEKREKWEKELSDYDRKTGHKFNNQTYSTFNALLDQKEFLKSTLILWQNTDTTEWISGKALIKENLAIHQNELSKLETKMKALRTDKN